MTDYTTNLAIHKVLSNYTSLRPILFTTTPINTFGFNTSTTSEQWEIRNRPNQLIVDVTDGSISTSFLLILLPTDPYPILVLFHR
jgi:hypothetical protein